MAEYMKMMEGDKLTAIWRKDTNEGIPLDENNCDYRDYLAWVEEGNTPEDKPAE